MSSGATHRRLRIFLGCPGDVFEEKERLISTVDSLREIADRAGYFIELKEWSQVAPNLGRPQQVILDQIPPASWDVFVGILWQRFGAPTGVEDKNGLPYNSGTQEEFECAYELFKKTGRPRVLFYRCIREAAVDKIDPEQLLKVIAFFKNFQVSGAHPGLYYQYRSVEDFGEQVRSHLTRLILEQISDTASPTASDRAEPCLPSLDAANYGEAILKRFRHLRLETLSADQTHYHDIELRSVFIPQDVRNCQQWLPQTLEGPKELARKKGREENEELAMVEIREQSAFRRQAAQNALKIVRGPGPKNLVMLGDPGAGKSSLVTVQLLEWAVADKEDQAQVPILIELRHYHRTAGKWDFLEYLERGPDLLYRFSRDLIGGLLKAGKIVFLFDGLDEVFDPEARKAAANQIARLATEFPKSDFVVTSRLVGYPPRILRDAGFKHFLLQDFDRAKIDIFLDHWCKIAVRDDGDRTRVQQRVTVATQVPAVFDLAGNPLLLTMMAVLARQRDLPRDQAGLYEKCSELLLELWDTQKALSEHPDIQEAYLDLRDKHNILRLLAWKMQGGQRGLRGNLVGRGDVQSVMEEALKRIADPGRRRRIVNLLIDQLRERNFILCHLGGEHFAFVHRGFLEFFCAEEIRHRFESERTLTEAQLAELFRTRGVEDAWKEVLVLAGNSLDPKVADRVVSQTLDSSASPGRAIARRLAEVALAILNRARDPSALPATRKITWQFFADSGNAKTRKTMTRAVRALSAHWNDEPTRRLIKNWISSHNLVGGISILASRWPDADTKAFLNDIALRHKDDSSRREALTTLVARWDDKETEAVIRSVAENDYSRAGRFALENLIPRLPSDEGREYAKNVIQKHGDKPISRIAVGLLAKNWRQDDVRQLLVSYAKDPAMPELGKKAVQALAQGWKDDATKGLLEEIAETRSDDPISVDAVGCLGAQFLTADVTEWLWQLAEKNFWSYAGYEATAILIEKCGITPEHPRLQKIVIGQEMSRRSLKKPRQARYVSGQTKSQLMRLYFLGAAVRFPVEMRPKPVMSTPSSDESPLPT